MSAVSQLYAAMGKVWDKDQDKIIAALSREDGWDDRIYWAKESDPSNKDKSDNEIIEEWIWDRYSQFLSDFRSIAKDESGKLLIFRCIGVDDEDELIFHIAHGEPIEDYEGLGIYWAWDEAKAQCHWGSGTSSVTVHAMVPFNSIDVAATLELNLHPSMGEDEAEIRLKEGAEIEVLGVEKLNGEYVSPLDHGEKPIPMTAKKVQAYEERPFPVGPEPDGNYDRVDQVVEVGMPEMNRVELKEALLQRPYYLGREKRFLPDSQKFPKLNDVLKQEPIIPPPPQHHAEPEAKAPVGEEMKAEKKEFPNVEAILASEEVEAKPFNAIVKGPKDPGKGLATLMELLKKKGLKSEADRKPSINWELEVIYDDGKGKEKKVHFVVVEDDEEIALYKGDRWDWPESAEKIGKVSKDEPHKIQNLINDIAGEFWEGSGKFKEEKED